MKIYLFAAHTAYAEQYVPEDILAAKGVDHVDFICWKGTSAELLAYANDDCITARSFDLQRRGHALKEGLRKVSRT